MTSIASMPTIDQLFFLDIIGGRILVSNDDGSALRVIVSGLTKHPDGIEVDVETGYMYWTNMGSFPAVGDGSIQRANLDGSHITTIVPAGATYVPKQLELDRKNGKIYWSDREGMRIMRANIDGSQIETLIETGRGDDDRRDQRRWCVGIALDHERGQLYWTQKGGDDAGLGQIFRASIEIPAGQRPDSRTDIELLFDALPEPIDLALDLERRLMYWTDRGAPPRGNTLNRAPMDADPPTNRTDVTILDTGLKEGIGLALDLENDRVFFTDLGGSIYRARLDGSAMTTLLSHQGTSTGIAYVKVPLR
jgi:hypothetical protein